MLSGLRGWQGGAIWGPRECLCPLPGAHLSPTWSGRDSGALEQGQLCGGSRDSHPPPTPIHHDPHLPSGPPVSLVSRDCGACCEEGSPARGRVQRRPGPWGCDGDGRGLGRCSLPLPLPQRPRGLSVRMARAAPASAPPAGGASDAAPSRQVSAPLLLSSSSPGSLPSERNGIWVRWIQPVIPEESRKKASAFLLVPAPTHSPEPSPYPQPFRPGHSPFA